MMSVLRRSTPRGSAPALAALALLVSSVPAPAGADPSDGSDLSQVARVVIDPGHGGCNEGAVGVEGIYERFLTLAMAKLIRSELEARHPTLEVLQTRDGDVDVGLGERTHFANRVEADLFISLHFNAAANPRANGIEVYYLSAEDSAPPADPAAAEAPLQGPSGAVVASILRDLEASAVNRRSARLAELVQERLVRRSGATDRGVRQARYRVLRGAQMPAIVVELGFLTHEREGRRVFEPDYARRLITGLVEGIEAYDAWLAAERAGRAD
jgi:N-acetylmuramoyl-L-alanine amidase